MWNTKEKNNQKKIQLLGQGTYGCVYRPALHCKTMKPISKRYVSKIQKKEEMVSGEIEFGNRIKENVRNYSLYFAPILETCDIRISQLDDEQLNQCEPIQKNKNEAFSSNKMEYVGKQTLGEYFEHVLEKAHSTRDMQRFLMKLVDTHIYLLNSAEQLNHQNIIHLDIKGNNVMYHENNNVFVIIDFGLSVDSRSLELTNYTKEGDKSPFGILVDSYMPWNIDILLLSYIARQIQPKGKNNEYEYREGGRFDEKITDTKPMKQMVTRFVKDNRLFKNPCFSEKELLEFEKKYHAYIQTWREKTWREAWNELQKHKKSWDAYSINVMFLRLLMSTNITNFLKENTKEMRKMPEPLLNTIKIAFTGNTSRMETVNFFKQYIGYLKTTLLSTPTEHCVPLDCISKIKAIFNRVPVEMMEKWEGYMKNSIVTSKNRKKMSQNGKETTLQNIREGDKLMRRMLEKKVLPPVAPAQ